MNKLISIIFLTFLVFAENCLAQSDLLSRVPQLQRAAEYGNGGAFGCGTGQVTLVTSLGEIKTEIILDIVGVFGEKAAVTDLLTLLEARIQANKTGEQNSMSDSKVNLLVSMTLQVLGQSKDPTVISAIEKLLDDKEIWISGKSAQTLLWLAQSGENLQKKIEKITFPKSALKWAEQRNVKVPSWVKVKDS